MEQITVKVEDDFYEKLKVRMDKKGCKTIAQCARELLELGRRIEETAEKQSGDNSEDNMIEALLMLLKTNMKWSLETRFFVKFLMENRHQSNESNISEFIVKAKERAEIVVEDLLEVEKNKTN